MRTVTITPQGTSTTQLGFGCSSLMGAMTRKESLRMLDVAFDAGVRHFDVAPMYGYGQAEACLGDLLARHRGEVTVTTKYGIPPASNQSLLSLGRRFARPVLKLLPGLKSRLNRAAGAVAGGAPKSPFTPEQAQAGLESSLRELHTDHIDLWLLHEVDAGDLAQQPGVDKLFQTLESAVSSGKVGSFGIASGREKVPALLATHPAFCPVAQYEWSVLDPAIGPTAYMRLHHRAISEPFQILSAALARRVDIRTEWSRELGADLAQPGELARLMLKAAVELNPACVVLFSSRKPAHMKANVELSGNPTFTEAAQKLHVLVQRRAAELGLVPIDTHIA